MRKGEPVSASRRRRRERGIWQRRYWEHTIRDEDDFGRHLDYIHFNPVKHGHVEYMADWPFSSFHRMVRLAKRGGEYEVMPGETIIEVLRRHGVETRTSCELGYCGTCLTRYLAGEPDHRDPILGEGARKTHLLICCSRAKSRELVLDL